MKKRIFQIMIFIALTLAGTSIGVMIAFDVSGKQLTFGIMGIISLFISAWTFYNNLRKIQIGE